MNMLDPGSGQTAGLPVGGLPRPSFVSDDWLLQNGVDDPTAFWAAMRPEAVVMSPEALRAVKATRLSFARTLTKRMTDERWRVDLRYLDVDAVGDGLLLYDISAANQRFTFVARSVRSDGQDRLGRFYESNYDFYGAVLEGRATLERAREEAGRMERHVWSGRTDLATLGWTVANRSNRFFSHVADRLVAGRQPDLSLVATGGGYIIRNAGWYGNGRHGSRAWLSLPPDHAFAHPYHLDLFALYMWRLVGIDVVDAMAAKVAPSVAVSLDEESRRFLGVGNSSGIGMVAALVRWPAWLGTFNLLREMVIARALTRQRVPDGALEKLRHMLDNAEKFYRQQPQLDVAEVEQPKAIADGLATLAIDLAQLGASPSTEYPFRQLAEKAAATSSREVLEQLYALLIEIEPHFAAAVDTLLYQSMNMPRTIDPWMTVGAMSRLLDERYGWALSLDLSTSGARHHFWYKSEENGENRRGERDVDPGIDNETFVDVAGSIQVLAAALASTDTSMSMAEFLLAYPEMSNAVSRAQLAQRLPYTEIQANIIHRDFLPMDGIRFLLSTYGLENSMPYSTRWVRGVFFQGAPLADELSVPEADVRLFPLFDLAVRGED